MIESKGTTLSPDCTIDELKAHLYDCTECCRWAVIIGVAMEVVGICVAILSGSGSYVLLAIASVVCFCSILMLHCSSTVASEYPPGRLLDVDADATESERAFCEALAKAGLDLARSQGLCLIFSLCGAYGWVRSCVAGKPVTAHYGAGLLMAFGYVLVFAYGIAMVLYLLDTRRTFVRRLRDLQK